MQTHDDQPALAHPPRKQKKTRSCVVSNHSIVNLIPSQPNLFHAAQLFAVSTPEQMRSTKVSPDGLLRLGRQLLQHLGRI
jgi:hypothetical protein